MENTARTVASVGIVLMATGCGGQVGQAIRGVRNLEPGVEKRDRQVEELVRPAGVDPASDGDGER